MSRKNYEEEIADRLKILETAVHQLREELNKLDDELSEDQIAQFSELDELRKRSRSTFQELVDASDEKFDDVQDRMEQYWRSLGREIKAFDDQLKH